MKKGDEVRLGLVDGYEDYEGTKATIVGEHKTLNLYYLKLATKIDGDDFFFASPKEICPLNS